MEKEASTSQETPVPVSPLDMWVYDGHDTPLMDVHKMEGAFVGNATPDEMHEFLRRAILQDPTKVVFEVGKAVEILRPITTREFILNNPHIREAVAMLTEEPADTGDKLKLKPIEVAAKDLAEKEGISVEEAAAKIKSVDEKLKEK